MNLIEKLLYYISNKDISIFVGIEYDDISDFNVAIINLLDWLKLQYKRKIWIDEGKKDFRKPMIIPLETSWGLLLTRLLKSSEFKSYFEINGDKISLSSEFSEDEKNTIYKMAYDGYNPIRFI